MIGPAGFMAAPKRMDEAEILADMEAVWVEESRLQAMRTPRCHLVPMVFHMGEEESWWECRHCRHSKSSDWTPAAQQTKGTSMTTTPTPASQPLSVQKLLNIAEVIADAGYMLIDNRIRLRAAIARVKAELSPARSDNKTVIAQAWNSAALAARSDMLEAGRAAWEYSFTHSSATGRGETTVGPCLTYDRAQAFGVGCFGQRQVVVLAESAPSGGELSRLFDEYGDACYHRRSDKYEIHEKFVAALARRATAGTTAPIEAEHYPGDSLTRLASDMGIAASAAARNGRHGDAAFIRQWAGRALALDQGAGTTAAPSIDFDKLQAISDQAEANFQYSTSDGIREWIKSQRATAGNAAPTADKAELHFNATRLRNLARLVGLENAIPQDDESLDGARGAVLGLIARTLSKRATPAATAAPGDLPEPFGTMENVDAEGYTIGWVPGYTAKQMYEFRTSNTAAPGDLTDVQIIRAFWKQSGRDWTPSDLELSNRKSSFGYFFSYGQLIDAVREVLASNAGAAPAIPEHLREFVQAFVNWSINEHEDEDCCRSCSGLAVWNEATEDWDTHHRPECPVLRAEALLAAAPSNNSPAGAQEKA